ncbi:odorant receptor 4-like isoform X2 [Maniola hyperantus]|uniref:odorant receptor 4-like isoform X2 n=1 Tax=Aphantopus hyperantus TaxID=2795564 RepID=UPI00156A2B62|nr:odorant receptor 4-like [Maniola hyperantus]
MFAKYKEIAKEEIHKTLKLCNFCTRKLGISFIDEQPTVMLWKVWNQLWLIGSAIVLFLKVSGQVNCVVNKLATSSSVEDFVASLHIVGYDTMSFGKLLTIWWTKDIFRSLLIKLEDLWPTSEQDEDAVEIKNEKLSRLRVIQFWYAFWNILGVWLYNLTPVVIYIYHKIQGGPAHLGYIWHLSYPFDKSQPVYHELAFAFEMYSGVVSVWSMLGSDILFMTMASHISMLLRLLQFKIRRLAVDNSDSNNYQRVDCFDDIVGVIKIHQRLITYGNDLKDAFSVVFLINVLLSSVNICCVVFNILLDPWMAMSNKFFLGAALTQVGILCWYADDIFTSSSGIADAVYESGWYSSNIRCQRTLMILLQRSQKPLYFTAYKFSSITMSTYSSILTSSYSYFTLLYTVYRSD